VLLHDGKVKVKVSLPKPLRLHRDGRVVGVLSLNLGPTLWRNGQRHAPTALLPGKEPPVTRFLGGWVGPRAPLVTLLRSAKPLVHALNRIQDSSC
jgi:hypothetical protein